jgi:autotransporter-associated beta strand protein
MKPELPNRQSLLLAATTLAVFPLLAPSASAQSNAWVGNGAQTPGNAIWGGVANWVNSSVANGPGNTATFGNSFNNGYTCIVNTDRTIGSIIFNDPANANNLLLELHPTNFRLILNNNGPVPVINVVQSGRSMIINPRIDGTGGLSKTGPGTLRINNANIHSGPTTILAGTLTLGNAQALQNSVLDTATSIAGDSANGLKTAVTTLALGGLSGDKALASLFTTSAGGYDTVTALTLNPASGTLAYSGNLTDGAAGMTLTKTGAGTQSLDGANTYTGATTVSAGTLRFSTAGSATTNITVATAATAGVLVAANNGQWVNSGDLIHDANSTLVIDFGASTPGTTVAPLKVANLTVGADLTLSVAADSFAGFAVGQSYPLVTWTTNGPPDAADFTTLLLAHRVAGNLSVVGNTLFLNVTANAAGPISWNTGNGSWDTAAPNWVDVLSAPVSFVDTKDGVLFGDASGATGNPVVTLGSVLAPASVTMSSTNRDYTVSGGGGIAGSGPLTLAPANTRTLTLGTANTYTGNTTVSGGTLKLGADEVIPDSVDGAGTGNLVLNGTLDLNGFSESVNGLSGTGTVDSLVSGSPVFAVGGNNASGTFGGVIKNTAGELALAKSGSGRLILTGANTHTGGTTVGGGVLQVGDGGTSGSLGTGPLAVTAGSLEFRRSDDLTVAGPIDGAGGIAQSGSGALTLAGENTYSGATIVSNGTLNLTGDRLTQATAGFTVGNTAAQTATLSVSNGTFTVGTAGSNFQVGAAVPGATGIMNQTGGSLTTIGNQLLIGNLGATGTYNLSGGTLTTIAGTLGVTVGVNTGSTATFNLSADGVLNMPPTSTLQITRSDNSAATGVTGTFNQTGGTATVGILRMGGGGTGNNNANATLNLSGGTFAATTFNVLSAANDSSSTIQISGTANVTLPAFPTVRGSGSTATLTFDGGTLKPAAASAAYLGGLTNAFIKAGGATLDTTNGNITITQNLLGDGVSTGGGLTKTGSGELTLAGANTYTGTTTVNAGTLKFPTTVSSATSIAVADGATAGVLVAASNGQWANTGNLTYANNSTVLVDFGAIAPGTTVAPLKVANLALGSGMTLRVTSPVGTLLAGQSYPMLTWTGSGPVNGSAFTSIVSHRVAGNLNVIGNTLFLNVTTGSGAISWNTGDGNWNTDAVPTNWVDTAASATFFIDALDAVLLGDASGATGNPTVTLTGKVSPVSVTMNSTARDYTLTGAEGAISGGASLTLDAANTRTLSIGTSLNDYSGNTTVNGGTLKLLVSEVIPHGAGKGNLTVNAPGIFDLNTFAETVNGLSGSGIVDTVAGGTPVFTVGSNNATSTFSGTIKNTAGSLALVKTGTGTLTLAGANTYSGTSSVTGGTLQFATTAALYNGATASWTAANLKAGNAATLAFNVGGTNEFTSANVTTLLANLGGANGGTAGGFATGSSIGFDTTNAAGGQFTVPNAIANSTGTGGGAVGVTKLGTGTLNLTAIGTYSGATIVSNGVLNLSGVRVAQATGGFTVGNTAAQTATLSVSAGSFTVGTAGSNFLVGATVPGTTGIMNQTGGILTTIGNQLLIGNAGATGTYNLSGGTLNTIAGGLGVTLGVNTGSTATFNLSAGGILNMPATSTLQITRSDNSAATEVTGTFNQTGGTATVGILRMGGGGTGNNNANATLNLSGGTFAATTFNVLSAGNNSRSTIQISGTADVTLPAFPTIRGVGATATLTFDGGTLKPRAASPIYLGGLTNAFIKAGGATFNTSAGSITISQALLTDPVSTGGGLTKSGTNTLALAGANTYTGATTVSAGTLQVNSPGSLAAASAVAVNGGTLGGNGLIGGSVTVAAAANLAPGAAAGTLSIGGALDISAPAAGAGTLAFELDALAGTSDRIAVAGTLTIGSGALGLDDLVITNLGGLEPGTYKLITSGGINGTLDPSKLSGLIGTFAGTLQLSGNDLELVISPSSYGTWIAGFNVGALTGPNDDPDRDGTTNLVEFALNSSPADGGSQGKVFARMATVGGTPGVLTLTVAVRSGATFVAAGNSRRAVVAADLLTYLIEASDNLVNWGTPLVSEVTGADATAIQATLTPSAPEAGWVYKTFRTDGAAANDPSDFIRAAITSP